jgi:hypothetical protein
LAGASGPTSGPTTPQAATAGGQTPPPSNKTRNINTEGESMRFNPPPNWPLPAGWTPPPGWVPDPSWGPAPPGWQLWVDDYSAAPTAYGQSVPPQYPVSGGQWAPGPPGYYGPPPRSNKTRNILIGAGVGVAVIVAVVLTLVFTLGGPESDEDQIRGVIRGMETAWNNKDHEAFKNYYCKKVQSGITQDKFNSRISRLGKVTIEVKKVTVSGDSAEADVNMKYSKSSSSTTTTSTRNPDAGNDTLHFKKEDGKWKDCNA